MENSPKIIQILPASGWKASYSNNTSKVVVLWALDSSGRVFGLVDNDDGKLVNAWDEGEMVYKEIDD